MKPHVKISGAYTHYEKILPVIIKHRALLDFSVYDGINECRWNGGRVNRPIFDDPVRKQAYERLGVGISLAFTNPTIDVSNSVGNELLEKYHVEGNSIILQNADLLAYVRHHYPKYECIFSITGHPAAIDDPVLYYRELEAAYDIIVPKLEHNMLIEQYTQKLHVYELLINDDCLYFCPLWKKHFDKISHQNTLGIKYYDKKEVNFKIEECWLPRDVFDPDIGDLKARAEHGFRFGMSLTTNQIKDRFATGIHRLKISGREMSTGEFQANFEMLVKAIKEATT